MDRTLAELEELVRTAFAGCVRTARWTEHAGWKIRASARLFRLFPQVAEAIQAYRQRQYRRLHQSHPAPCLHGVRRAGKRLSCGLRKQVQCALDAYLLLVVEAIEEATGKTSGTRYLPGPNDRPISIQL